MVLFSLYCSRTPVKLALLASVLGGITLAQIPFMAQAMEPISAGSIVSKDLPESLAEKITIELDTARFDRQSVGHLTLKANKLNLREGTLQAMDLSLKNGQFGERLQVDDFKVVTSAFAFDAFELLNKQRFILNQPIDGRVSMHLSSKNLNQFLSHPKTISKIEKAIAKQTGGIQLIRLSNPVFNFMSQKRIQLDVTAVVGEALSIPLKMLGNLILKDGNVVIKDLNVISGGSELPVEVSKVFQDQLNQMISLDKFSKPDFMLKADHLSSSAQELHIEGQARISALKLSE